MGAQNVPHTSTVFPGIPFYLIGNTWRYCRGKKEARTAIWLSALFQQGEVFGLVAAWKPSNQKGRKYIRVPHFFCLVEVSRLSLSGLLI